MVIGAILSSTALTVLVLSALYRRAHRRDAAEVADPQLTPEPVTPALERLD